MLTSQLTQSNARHAAFLSADVSPGDADAAPASAVVPRCALDQAAGNAAPAATRATLALFNRGALVDARSFSF